MLKKLSFSCNLFKKKNEIFNKLWCLVMSFWLKVCM